LQIHRNIGKAFGGIARESVIGVVKNHDLQRTLRALSGGEASYAMAAKLFASPVGLLFLIGWSFSFLYHLLNGVRHLFWDVGRGFERTQRHASGWFVVLGSIALTACIWGLIWAGHRP